MSKTNFVATSLAPRAATLSSRLVAPRPSSLGVWRTGTLRSVQTNTAWSRGALCAGRLARTPRRNFSAQQSPNPAAEPPPSAEEPLVHNVETLSESYYAFQESVLNFQVMGASVPRFWVGLVVFGLTGLVKDFVTLSAGDVLQRPELTEDQKLAIWATAGDKEDFVLNQLPVAVSMSDPWTLLTIPLLSSLFAASVGIWWGRMRVRKLFDKFIFLETQKGHISAPEVVEGARKGIISRGATITAIGTMALTTTYISFYALVTRFWFRDYVDQMNEWRWKVPEGKEGELLAKLPSDVQLHGYSLATFLYFVFIQLLVLKITPFVIVPSFAAFFPMMTVLSQSPVILRVMDKQRAKVETLEAAGALPVSPRLLAGESGDDSLSSEFLAEEGSDEADDGSGGASPSLSGNVFDKSAAHGPGRVRALVSRKKHDQQHKDQDRAIAEVLGDDEGHGKENQWGDVVLEDEANQQA